MLPKKQRKKMLRQLDTLIGSQTHLVGDILFHGGLRVDGSITGNISSNNDPIALLTLSETGRIEGEIRASNLIINGTIIGDIYSTGHLELAANTKITGTVYYNLLQMEEGAEINGNLIHVKENDAALEQIDDQSDDQMMLANHQNEAG